MLGHLAIHLVEALLRVAWTTQLAVHSLAMSQQRLVLSTIAATNGWATRNAMVHGFAWGAD